MPWRAAAIGEGHQVRTHLPRRPRAADHVLFVCSSGSGWAARQRRTTLRRPLQEECSPSCSLALGHLAYAAQLEKVGTVAPQEGAFGEYIAPSCFDFLSFPIVESAVVSAVAAEDASETLHGTQH